MKTAELIEQRAGLVAKMRTAHEADKPEDFAAAEAELRAHDAKIERAKALDELDKTGAAVPLTGGPAGKIEVRAFASGAAAIPEGFAGEIWHTRDGNPLPALAPADKLASFLPTTESRAAELGIGGFLRALHAGPQSDLERRVLAEGAIGTGGAFVPTPIAAGIIDLLRAKSVTIQAGARTVPMTSQTLKIARQTADPVGGWRAENAAIAESDPTFDQVTLAAKAWAVRFNVSRELLEDGQNTDAAIRNILAGHAAVGLDQAVLVGTGAGNQPLGIRGQSGIQSVSMGTNGATLANWTPMLDAVRQLELANAGAIGAMVMSPRTTRQINGFVDTTNQWLQAPPRLASVPTYASTSIPVNETQGTSTDCTSIFLGDFTEVMIGLRTDLQITMLAERYAELGQVGFVAWMRADVALARPAAIARILGIRP